MGKNASQYFKGDKVMVSLNDKLREVAPTIVASGSAHLRLVKHRESNTLLLAETFYYVALESPLTEIEEDDAKVDTEEDDLHIPPED